MGSSDDIATPESQDLIAETVQLYLRTGESDPLYPSWHGGFMERAERAHKELRGALVSAVKRLAEGLCHASVPEIDTAALTRVKVKPMVAGLFPKAEQGLVLATVERAVVFLTDANIESVLFAQPFHGSAWTIANLYLTGVGAQLLADDAPRLMGLSEETTCTVSPEYFAGEAPFADFIVHEVAHIFHNTKRGAIGLRQTRTREWLLDIDYRKRETFAYSCEAYARILERARNALERRTLAEEYRSEVRISDERVDPVEVAGIFKEAVAARNGWKVILGRCAPARQPRVRSRASNGRPL